MPRKPRPLSPRQAEARARNLAAEVERVVASIRQAGGILRANLCPHVQAAIDSGRVVRIHRDREERATGKGNWRRIPDYAAGYWLVLNEAL